AGRRTTASTSWPRSRSTSARPMEPVAPVITIMVCPLQLSGISDSGFPDATLSGIESSSLGWRVRADAKRNLDKIVSAAAEVVAARGVSAPREATAKRAGVGVGPLYRRFPDRDSLIAAVGDHYVHTMAAALDEAASSGADAWNAIWDFVTWAAAPG